MRSEIVQRAVNNSYDILEKYPDTLVEWIISFKEDIYNITVYFDKDLDVDWDEDMFTISQRDGTVTYYDMDDIFSITIQY